MSRRRAGTRIQIMPEKLFFSIYCVCFSGVKEILERAASPPTFFISLNMNPVYFLMKFFWSFRERDGGKRRLLRSLFFIVEWASLVKFTLRECVRGNFFPALGLGHPLGEFPSVIPPKIGVTSGKESPRSPLRTGTNCSL